MDILAHLGPQAGHQTNAVSSFYLSQVSVSRDNNQYTLTSTINYYAEIFFKSEFKIKWKWLLLMGDNRESASSGFSYWSQCISNYIDER